MGVVTSLALTNRKEKRRMTCTNCCTHASLRRHCSFGRAGLMMFIWPMWLVHYHGYCNIFIVYNTRPGVFDWGVIFFKFIIPQVVMRQFVSRIPPRGLAPAPHGDTYDSQAWSLIVNMNKGGSSVRTEELSCSAIKLINVFSPLDDSIWERAPPSPSACRHWPSKRWYYYYNVHLLSFSRRCPSPLLPQGSQVGGTKFRTHNRGEAMAERSHAHVE